MASCTAILNRDETTVNMGKIVVAEAPHRFRSILGSCVGLAIYHSRIKVGVFAHIVLPESSGRTGLPGKFADTAIPHMIEMLRNKGILNVGLLAKMAGGANMFGKAGPLQIGDINVEAVTRILAAARIRIVAEHVGGTSGRRVTFDNSTAQMTIEIAGQPPRTI